MHEIVQRRSATDAVEVFIKFKCGASPAVTRFLVQVYADEWQHRLLETWELVVHALQRPQPAHVPAAPRRGLVEAAAARRRRRRVVRAARRRPAPVASVAAVAVLDREHHLPPIG